MMDWRRGRTANTYTLTVGNIHCRVWLTAAGSWAAIVRQYARSKGAYCFATPLEAKAWCEARLAEIEAREPMRQAGKSR